MERLKSYFKNHLPKIENNIQLILRDIDPYVRDVAAHILGSGGKRLRPMLCILIARAFGYTKEDIYPLACVLEFIHSATLLHDDIIDHAALRRGDRAAHTIFGETKTILAGDALLALSNQIVTRYKNISLLSCLSEAIYRTACGEILEIAKMKKNYITSDEYLEIITGKTAYLIQFSCESGAILAGVKKQELKYARSFGLNLGIAFQLVDDVLDYSLNHETIGKPVGGDLREGKITLPLIFYLDTLPKRERETLLATIKAGKLDQKKQTEIIKEINEKGICKKALEESEIYLNRARDALSNFPPSLEKQILEDVIVFVKERNK